MDLLGQHPSRGLMHGIILTEHRLNFLNLFFLHPTKISSAVGNTEAGNISKGWPIANNSVFFLVIMLKSTVIQILLCCLNCMHAAQQILESKIVVFTDPFHINIKMRLSSRKNLNIFFKHLNYG